MLKATALSRMYGDPSRVAKDALEGYTQGLHIPGTVDHVLQIVQRWFVDMGLLRSALSELAAKPTLLIWGDRDRAVGFELGARVAADPSVVEPACPARRRTYPLRRDARDLQSGDARLAHQSFSTRSPPHRCLRVSQQACRTHSILRSVERPSPGRTRTEATKRISCCIRSSFGPGDSAVP